MRIWRRRRTGPSTSTTCPASGSPASSRKGRFGRSRWTGPSGGDRDSARWNDRDRAYRGQLVGRRACRGFRPLDRQRQSRLSRSCGVDSASRCHRVAELAWPERRMGVEPSDDADRRPRGSGFPRRSRTHFGAARLSSRSRRRSSRTGFPAGEGLAVGLESAQAVRDAGRPAGDGRRPRRRAPHRPLGLRARAVHGRRAQGRPSRPRGRGRPGCRRRDDGRRHARRLPRSSESASSAPAESAASTAGPHGHLRRPRRARAHGGARRLVGHQVAARRPGDDGAPRVARHPGRGTTDGRAAALLHRARRPAAPGARRERRGGSRARAYALAPQAPFGARARPAAAGEHRRRRAADRGSAWQRPTSRASRDRR